MSLPLSRALQTGWGWIILLSSPLEHQRNSKAWIKCVITGRGCRITPQTPLISRGCPGTEQNQDEVVESLPESSKWKQERGMKAGREGSSSLD